MVASVFAVTETTIFHVSAAIKQHQKKSSADGTGDEKRSLTSETVDDDVKTQALIEATKDSYDEVNVSQTILLLSLVQQVCTCTCIDYARLYKYMLLNTYE